MIKAVVDLNVLLDFLNHRRDHENAARVVDLCVQKKIRAYLASHEVTTLAYFLLKEQKNAATVKKVLQDIFEIFTILPLDVQTLKNALHSKIEDFEDALLEESAVREGIDYIITNNLKDFAKSRLNARSPREFLLVNSEL